MTKVITTKQIRENYDLGKIIENVEEYYRLLDEKQIIIPARIFSPTRDGGDYLYGAATNLKNETFIVLSSPFMPWNKEKGLPIVRRVYLLTSYKEGDLLAIVEGSDITNLRTCAKSVVAAKYLASKNSKVLGFIGLGNQAKHHAEAFSKQFNIERIVGYSRTPEQWGGSFDYIKEKTGLEVEVLSREEVIRQSDILIVATHSKEPLVSYEELHQGQTVLGLDHAESVSRDLVTKSDKVFVDYLPTAQNEFGPVKISLESGYDVKKLSGDLGGLVTGKVRERENDEEVIFFQSLGVTNEDLAVVEYLYEKLKSDSKDINLYE